MHQCPIYGRKYDICRLTRRAKSLFIFLFTSWMMATTEGIQPLPEMVSMAEMKFTYRKEKL